MDWIVNNIQLIWKLAWMLRTYRTCNSTVKFSKYEFYNKLLDGVTLLKLTPDVTWTQLYIYISRDLMWESIRFYQVAHSMWKELKYSQVPLQR